MNLLNFLAIAIHPHTLGPNPLLRHPVSGAPPQQPQGLSGGWWLAPLAMALHPLPWHAAGCARGHQRLPPLGTCPALGLTSALISGSTKNRAEN